MSILSSGRVLRVTNAFPQPQDTFVSWYSGWMPSFIVDKSLRSGVSENDRVGPISITKPQILATNRLFGKGRHDLEKGLFFRLTLFPRLATQPAIESCLPIQA